ncbi:response regulator transcription factor [Paraflavitalea speifideaquila]|uniref:response regulator n=1 Tax=Paraflavitalea speifideaquila TaxID=3076558 RepID=UPI0028E2A1A5|nr:response regulator transcription factor [Paraflavitalea speifideiaquila]
MSQQAIKLFVVDDHKMYREFIIEILASKGFDIIGEAVNGRDFINAINPAQLPDIVIVDWNMPEMDGLETAQWIKANHPAVRVIINTTEAEYYKLRKIKASKIEGFVSKHHEFVNLIKALYAIQAGNTYYLEEA